MTLRIIGGILTGGTAGRMEGLRKGLLERVPGQTILEYLLVEMAHADLDPVLLLANEPEHYSRFGMPVVQDLRRRQGPLGGIEAALAHAAGHRLADAVVFVPCDAPAISRGEIGELRRRMELDPGGVKVAAVPDGGIGMRPVFCAVHCAVLPEISACLDRGERRLRQVWRDLGATLVEFEDESPFVNLNTPDDLRIWRKRMGCHDNHMRS